jgi:hypothetical protein
VTREELEEGRRLWSRRDLNQFPFEKWLLTHAAELLSLAEEARWRSVTEEPPELFATVLVPADENNDHVAAYLSHSGVWCACETESPLMPSEVPTHWRPLPKGPER